MERIMTPTELEEFCRQRYNAVGDTFFSSGEMLRYIWDAQMQLARETACIRSVYTTSTVASQQEYSFPTQTIAIKRVTVNGYRADPRTLEEVLDLTNSTAAPTGLSYIYAIWDEVLYLAPIPDAVYTLKIWSINEPAEVETDSTIEVPSRYQLDLADYVNEQMAIKDKNYAGSAVYAAKWAEKLRKAKADEQKLLRGQEFSFVKDVDSYRNSWGLIR
jgi:hypothetical protein